MNRLIPLLATAGWMFGGAQTFADVPTTPPTLAQKHQMMKDCMSKQMAANSGMSKVKMKESCKDEMMKPKVADPTASIGSGGPSVPSNH